MFSLSCDYCTRFKLKWDGNSVNCKRRGRRLRGSEQKQHWQRKSSGKRTDYISWEDYFMATAFLAAKRSKDPCTQVGACIVNSDNIILGVGYNGFPKGCSDDEFSWAKRKENSCENKHLYVCHAEVNAILNMNSRDAKACKMYVTLFPCNECAKFIIQSGIKEVFYMSDKNHNKVETVAAKKMFDAAEVKYSQFNPVEEQIIIDFKGNKTNGKSESSSSKKPCREETIDS